LAQVGSTPSRYQHLARMPLVLLPDLDHGVQHKGLAGDVDDARQDSADALVDVGGDRKFE
jgi:hypothetical protein